MLAGHAADAPAPSRRRRQSLYMRLQADEKEGEEVSVRSLLDTLKSQVLLVLTSFYKDFTTSYQHRIDLRDDIASVRDQLEEMGPPEKTNLHAKRENELMGDTITFLEALTKIHAEIQGMDQLVDTGEFVSAADSIVEMTRLLETVDRFAKRCGCPPDIVKAVKMQVISKSSHLQQKLQELFVAAFVLTSGADGCELRAATRLLATIGQNYFDSPIKSYDVLVAMERMGTLDSAIRRLSKRLISTIVTHIINHPSEDINVTRTRIALSIRVGFTPKSLHEVDTKHDRKTVSRILASVLKLAQALKEDVLSAPLSSEHSYDAFRVFAKIWGHDLCDELVRSCLTRSIPDNQAAFDEYATLVEDVQGFDQGMRNLGYFEDDKNPLVQFVAKIQRHYAHKQRSELLVLVRDVLESDDRNTVQVPGPLEKDIFATTSETKAAKEQTSGSNPNGKGGQKDGLEIPDMDFKFPTCHVSVQAQTIVELAIQTLEEVTDAPDAAKLNAFYCARDIFDAYRAILPVHHADSLENDPGRTMLFHNDCEYISFHLLILGYRYHKNLPYPLTEMGTFVDLVPSFRKMGEGYFRNQMRKQRDILLAKVADAQGFHNLGDDERCETVEEAIKATLYHLQTLSKAWKPIMASRLYFQSIGLLLNVLLHGLLKELAKLSYPQSSTSPSSADTKANDDAPEVAWTRQEAHQLRYLLSLIDKTEQYFETVSGAGKAKTVEKAPIPKYVPLWEPTREIVQLLDTQPAATVLQRVTAALQAAGATLEMS
ncbi:Centromere/kinetochore Zw10-domain-containing protein [Fimicolochytrium jonesii]|uniref:Centromere/kinetochore Zw10-domain-containing protein n=1 Tax=Fimicolochytrium jonesii TaxID=1396493 RepID=UPI0022FF2DC5|nr:Centromere/kinetochore Zw10-domain-containing protein [Fimicolochytrium jonesii]KAI8824780.1 Centromere/kinetochore Zw10-domain-containing protein [Fimicolochytrium jonesii]